MQSLRTTRSSSSSPLHHRTSISLRFWLIALFAFSILFLPTSTTATPKLILPTPPGEPWIVIQGYACGTHNAWDRYSLDLVQVNGPTYGAPVRAAITGKVWYWGPGSGTIILSHGGRFFTMYTHLGSPVTTTLGHVFEAGETLGYAGDRGSPGVPHLHFTAYTANSDGWSGKQSVALDFAEGYHLPEVGGCSQHQGTVMTAASLQDPQIMFTSPAQPNTWYNSDQRIEFTTVWGGGGISQTWDQEPSGDRPMFQYNFDGYANLSEAGEGMHTFYVRAWGPDGRQTLAPYGPVGYDVTPPANPPTITDIHTSAGNSVPLAWSSGSDARSGVAGYRIYVGTNPTGEDSWFTSLPQVTTPTLPAGTYVVRVQTLDRAGNSSAWVTIGKISVE